MENRPTYAIESVDCALRLLLLVQRDGSLRVSAAADELGVARSTAHRLLAMLKYRGFVVQDNDHRYVAGPQLRSLGTTAPGVVLPAIARRHMEELSKLVGETVNLLVRDGTLVRFIESVEGTEVLRVGSRVGVSLPAHQTSGGKVLLADLSRTDVNTLYSELAPESVELTAIHKQLSLTRRRGYGTNFQETEAGVIAVGVAIRNTDAMAVAAMTISGPTVRYRRTQIVDLLPQLRVSAERIRRELIGG